MTDDTDLTCCPQRIQEIEKRAVVFTTAARSNSLQMAVLILRSSKKIHTFLSLVIKKAQTPYKPFGSS